MSFRGFKPKNASQQYVAGKDAEDRNTLDNPNNVIIEQAHPEIEGDEILLTLAPHSVNVTRILG